MPVPVFTVGEVLTAANMNAVGLWRVTTCSVSSVGGTAATASNGVITIGSGNTSITVNNAFSADYDNYLVVFTGGSLSSPGIIRMQLGSTVTNYYSNLIYTNWNNVVQAVGTITGTSWNYAASGSTSLIGEIFVGSPFLSENSYMRASWISASDTGFVTGLLNNTTSYTSFTITPSGGSLTGGTIRVYGYRN